MLSQKSWMGVVSSLLLVLTAGCRTPQPQSPSSDPDALTSSAAPIDIDAPAATQIIDEMGDPAPELDKRLIMAQAFDLLSGRVLLTGLPGAAPASVERVCALNVSSTSSASPTCIAITSANGSFREWLNNTNVGDTIKVWGEGSTIGQTASIEEKVQYWLRRFPKVARSFYLEKSAAAPMPGLFIGADDGLYFIHRDDLDKDLAAVYPLRFGTESGLNGTPIVGIVSDGNGGLWITESFGREMTLAHVTWVNGHVQTDNFGTLNYDFEIENAHALIEDGSGGVWLGTPSGIGHFILINGQTSYVQYGYPHCPITAIVADQNGDFWLGSGCASIYRVKFVSGEPQFTTFRAPSDLLYKTTSFAFHTNGDLFVGTTGGLGQIQQPNGSDPAFVSHASSVPHYITDLAIDSTGRLLISTRDAGIQRFSPTLGTENFVAYPGLPYPAVDRLFYDHNSNKLWAGVSDGTLTKWSQGDVVRIAEETGRAIVTIPNSKTNSLLDNAVTAVATDGATNVWVGTGFGLSYLDYSGQDAQFRNLTTKDGLGSDYVTSLATISSGEAWVGTSDFLEVSAFVSHVLIQQNNQIQIMNYALPSWPVSMVFTSPNDIWIATSYSGLYRLTIDSNGVDKLECYNDLVSGDATSLAYNSDGSLWIGSRVSGLYRLSFNANGTPNVEHFEIAPTPYGGPDPVTSLAPDGAGGVWVAHTRVPGLGPVLDAGLYHVTFDANRNPHLDRFFNDGNSYSSDPISSNEISSLLADGPSSVWVGTNLGMDHLTVTPTGFDTTPYASGNLDDGLNILPHGNVATLVRHPLGGIFAGTANGLALINQ